jgi:ribosomal protein L40E
MRRTYLVPLLIVLATVAVVLDGRPVKPVLAEEGGAHEFIGANACKKCHFKTHKSWKKTVHANAMDILKPGERAEAKTKAGLDPAKDYTTDPKCLKCHTTGYGHPGGYPEVKDAWSDEETKRAKENAGVGCESCHGPGGDYAPYKKDHEDYKLADVVSRGLEVPSAETCTKCHNNTEGNPTAGPDYTFDYETMKAKSEAIHEHEPLKMDHK